MAHLRLVTGLSALFVIGCDQGSSENDLSARIEELESRLKLEEDYSRQLGALIRDLDSNQHEYDSAEFDPAAAPSFRQINAGLATFAVSLQDVKPQADGSKVLFDVGNVTSATFSGAQFSVKYGTRPPPEDEPDPFNKRRSEWRSTLKTAEIVDHGKLLPGTWNKVWLTLPGVQAEHLGYISVSIKASTAQMTEPR